MASTQSKGFHKFSVKHLPFLLRECPVGNLHFLWHKRCVCGVRENNGATYIRKGRKWIEKR